MVEYLVRTAAVLELDLNHVDHDGANVLFYCAASGRLNLLRLLLKVFFIYTSAEHQDTRVELFSFAG